MPPYSGHFLVTSKKIPCLKRNSFQQQGHGGSLGKCKGLRRSYEGNGAIGSLVMQL